MPYDEPKAIAELIETIKRIGPQNIESLVMNASTYAGIRKLGREDLDIESQPSLWKTGHMGTLLGVGLKLAKEKKTGAIGMNEKSTVATYCCFCSKRSVGSSCLDPECLVKEILEK